MKVQQTIFGYDILSEISGETIYGHFLTQMDAEIWLREMKTNPRMGSALGEIPSCGILD